MELITDHVLIGNPHAVINLSENNISEEQYHEIALDIQRLLEGWNKCGLYVNY